MKIAVAQHHPISGNVEANLKKHLELIEEAISHQVDAIFFNELSITGYEPTQASELKIRLDDDRFDLFQKQSDQAQITIGIGVPLSTNQGIEISTLLFQPHSRRSYYSKQLLHESETPYFIPGTTSGVLPLNDVIIGLGICYESMQEEHLKNYLKDQIDIYLVATAKKQEGMPAALAHYQAMAEKYQLPIMMTNSYGACSPFICMGRSSIWNKNGECIEQLLETDCGILIYDTDLKTATAIKK